MKVLLKTSANDQGRQLAPSARREAEGAKRQAQGAGRFPLCAYRFALTGKAAVVVCFGSDV